MTSISGGNKNEEGYLLLSEVALGNMYKCFKAQNFKKPPLYYHSVYGVGGVKPKLSGIKDLKSKDQENFTPEEETAGTPSALFFNTGRLSGNPDLKDLPVGMTDSDLKVNEFVVYDIAQVRMKYLV